MMKRGFEYWFVDFRKSINKFDYYVDFNKVYDNVDEIKVELNILNSLIGSKSIEKDFRDLCRRYPQVLKCVPILIAVREKEIFAMDANRSHWYDFKNFTDSTDDYCELMRRTGLFDLLSNHLISNLVDYTTGVEVGLDSNGRKNRGGHQMEDLVLEFIKKTGCDYYKEMYLEEIERRWGYDLSALSNDGGTRKRFDFVVRNKGKVFAIETNFYTGGGSKLNETARSYKTLALEAAPIKNFEFVWITDGQGWKSTRGGLKETFDVLDNIFNIKDLEEGALVRLFNS